MALALVNKELSEEQTFESLRLQIVAFKGDSSYTTGGSAGVAAFFGFSKINAMVPLTHKGYVWEYDQDTDRLRFYQQPAAAAAGGMPEVPNATNLSGQTYRALVIGQ